MDLVILHGTVRKGQYSQYVSEFVVEVAKEHTEVETVTLIDPRDYLESFENEGTAASPEQLSAMISEADGYIVVTPEYNHGYPGSLKHMIDMHYDEYRHKPVSLVGASSGRIGGARVIEQLVPVLRAVGLIINRYDVTVDNVEDEFSGTAVANPDGWRRRINKMLDEQIFLMKTMKYGRQHFYTT